MSRTAVVLFNLGGPNGKDSIAPFLFNFFMDKNIIRLPLPARFLLAKLISSRRSKREADTSYAALGYRSPLLANTQAQATALQAQLGSDYRVFVCMRYWHPMADEVVRAVKDFSPDKIILLPLYPQFSTTTTRSSFGSWEKAARAHGLNVPTEDVCCYPVMPGFIAASAELVGNAYRDALAFSAANDTPPPRILFSAHGLPEDVIRDGDPYQWQCERSAQAIAGALKIENLDWRICYQSRVGPKKWIGPSTEEALHQAAADKVPVVIYPHAFVSEHVETLVEIGEEYRLMAQKAGIPYFARVDTAGISQAFISGLAALVADKATRDYSCPGSFRRCWKNCRAAIAPDRSL